MFNFLAVGCSCLPMEERGNKDGERYIILPGNMHINIFASTLFLLEHSHLECINNLKQQLQKPFCMELIILGAWLTRNANNIRGVQPSLYRCRSIFKAELKWLNFRAKRENYNLFVAYQAWLDSFI
jgi:hypothetical protein